MPATPRHNPPVCVHCDADLSCGNCGVEQPYTDISIVKAKLAAASARVVELTTGLSAAAGYLRNASIDLSTGCTKAAAQRKIEGGLKVVEAALVLKGAAALSQTEEGQS